MRRTSALRVDVGRDGVAIRRTARVSPWNDTGSAAPANRPPNASEVAASSTERGASPVDSVRWSAGVTLSVATGAAWPWMVDDCVFPPA